MPDRVPRYCPWCAAELWPHQAGPHLICSGCGEINFRNPVVGVAVVVIQDRRILLGRRAGAPYGGLWCIPCGYVEWNEDVRAAARREFREECGLEVALGEVITVHSNFHNRSKQTVGIWFRGTVIGGELQAGDDLDAVAYFAFDAIPQLAFPTDALVIDQLRGD